MGLGLSLIHIYDRMDPSYTIFHKESETFSSLWTAYTPDLGAFYSAWEADMAQFGTVPGPVARAPEPGQGIFNVSAVPWTSSVSYTHLQARCHPKASGGRGECPSFLLAGHHCHRCAAGLPAGG